MMGIGLEYSSSPLHVAFPIILISRIFPSEYLFEKPTLTSTVSRWTLMLFKFDLAYVTSKSMKGRTIV